MNVSLRKTFCTITLAATITFAPPSHAFFLLIAEAIAAAAEAIKTSQTLIRVANTVSQAVKTVRAVQSVVQKAQTAVKTVRSFTQPLMQRFSPTQVKVNFSIHHI